MAEPRADDLCIVIPTRGRPDILRRTIAAALEQTVTGHEIVVVVDGLDETPPSFPSPVRVITQAQAGPGAARNAGVAATDRPLVLFLGNDMIPTPALVERHLARHAAEPAAKVAVLGRVRWHERVAANPINRWLEWSATQFDYDALDREHESGAADAGFGRFYSSNVSVKRSFFLEAGGFDPAFSFFYEDLDAGFRFHEKGMVLRYDPAAVVHHLHAYDWPALEARFRGIAEGERVMVATHEWFEPFFRNRLSSVLDAPRVWSGWARVVDHVPASLSFVRRRADRWYRQRLADPFFEAWEGARDLDELRRYLGDAFDEEVLRHHVHEVEAEEAVAVSEREFFKTSERYLYDLTVFSMSGTKAPYRRLVRQVLAPGGRVLDYGCGIGADGLRLLEQGYRVEFADFNNPSVAFLRWRLRERRLDAPIHDVESDISGGFDVVYSFDVIEHVDDPFAFLDRLERLAELVVVNFLEPLADDTHLHKPLPIEALLDHCDERGLLHYSVQHGRSHLVAYRSAGAQGAVRRLRSKTWRTAGSRARAASLVARIERAALRVRAR